VTRSSTSGFPCAFLAANVRARLQWRTEVDFTAFETSVGG
jgi:hypothetical protein